MKRYFILFWIFLTSISLFAQLREKESVLVYYMPQTELVLDIEYEQTIHSRGRFYQYSERYLGTKDAVLSDATTYALRSVKLHTRTVADTTRRYCVSLDAKTLSQYSIRLTDKGLLESINGTDDIVATVKHQKQTDENVVQDGGTMLMPLLEEQLLAGSLGKMAESVAKQIYAIRESRLNLLSGDVEHTPADGRAMQLVLEEMEQQERLLTELFVGTRKTTVLKKQMVLIPTGQVEDEVLFRFSRHEGVLDYDNMSGEPYVLNLVAHIQEYAPADEKVKPQPASPFYHNIPGSADIVISNPQGTPLIERSVSIAQFGIALPLAADLFTKRKTQVVFDTKTGGIKHIK